MPNKRIPDCNICKTPGCHRKSRPHYNTCQRCFGDKPNLRRYPHRCHNLGHYQRN